MFPSSVRTRNQRKTEEESRKYNSKRKYNSNVKFKKPTGVRNEWQEQTSNAKKRRNDCNEGQEQVVNANKPVGVCNEGEEQAIDAFNVDQERLCTENERPSDLNADAEMEFERPSEVETANTSRKKVGRGPTKAKRLPLTYQSRIEVEFNDIAVPIGPGSVYLSSFLGPLVREHVPYTLDDWRLLNDELKTVLWESIQGKESSKEGSTHALGNANVCELLNWDGTSEVVAEGRVVSTDPNEAVDGIRIGPNAVSVVIDCVDKPDAYLWRPTPHMSVLGNAENKVVAWPATCIRMTLQGHLNEVSTSNSGVQDNRCKIFDWNEDDVIVAEGRICSGDSGHIVNGIPLGPSAVVVLVDNVKKGDAYLWRPTTDISCIRDAVGRKVAWPKSKVEVEKGKGNVVTSSSGLGPINSKKPHQHPIAKLITNNKCKIIDVGETNEVVAEGTIASTDPTSMVHCRPLGCDAVKVWVDFVRVPDAMLWRPTSELTCMEDAFGTTIAWPISKVIGETK